MATRRPTVGQINHPSVARQTNPPATDEDTPDQINLLPAARDDSIHIQIRSNQRPQGKNSWFAKL